MKIQGLMLLSLSLVACTNANLPNTAESATRAPAASLVVADKAMGADQVVYAKTSAGGLIGSLFVQPRGLMTAPDTQIVGCSQAGEGALGLDAYLNQPSWLSQNVLLTGLFVPTRNFSLGFPAADAILPVKSYFALDARGFFKLADGEPEGDYQFAVIADDGARLLIGNGEGYALAVDDEKPAGPNGGCLERTQSAHMSCSASWADQSRVKTVHVRPGDRLPIDFQYWQGPGFGLSMMAFYRRMDQTTDAACGQELGFGENGAALNAVLARWTPIAAANLTNSTAP